MKLFVSYAPSDLPHVQELVKRLQDAGHEAWYDHETPSDPRWEKALREQIESCDGFITVVSRDSLKSEWNKREFRTAKKAKMPIFAVLVNTNAGKDFVSEFKAFPRVDCSGGVQDAAVADLLAQIASAAERSPHKPKAAPAPLTGTDTPEDDADSGPQLVEAAADMPDEVKSLLTQANGLLSAGQWDKAINKLDEIVTHLPENPLVYAARGDAYLGLERFDKALEDYDRVLQLAPENAKAYDTRANLHRDLEHVDEAIRDFSESLRLDPEHAFPHISRGMLYYQQGKIDDTLNDFKAYTEKEPDDFLGHNNLAFVLFQQGKYEEAEAEWRVATSLEDPDDYVFAGHAVALEQLKRPAEALEMYKKAVQLNRRWKNRLDTVGTVYSWTEPMLVLATQIIGRLRAR